MNRKREDDPDSAIAAKFQQLLRDNPQFAEAFRQLQFAQLQLQATHALESLVDRKDYCGVARLAVQVIEAAPDDADQDEILPFALNLAWALAVSHEACQVCPPDDVISMLDSAIGYLSEKKGEGPRLADALSNYGTVRTRCTRGDAAAHMSAAIGAYDRSIQLFSDAGSQYTSKMAHVLLHRANATAFRPEGDPSDNIEMALSLTRTAREKFNSAGDRTGAARALSSEGKLLPMRMLGAPAVNWSLANLCHQEALSLWKGGAPSSLLEEEIKLAGTETELSTFRSDPKFLQTAIVRLRRIREAALEIKRPDLFANATAELVVAYSLLVKTGTETDLNDGLKLAEEFIEFVKRTARLDLLPFALMQRAGIYLKWCRRQGDLSRCRLLYRWLLKATRAYAREGRSSETTTLRFSFAEFFEERGLQSHARKLYLKLVEDSAFDVQRGLTLSARSRLSDVFYRASQRLALLVALEDNALASLAILDYCINAAFPVTPQSPLATEYRSLLAKAEMREAGETLHVVEQRGRRLRQLREQLLEGEGNTPKLLDRETLGRHVSRLIRKGDMLVVPLLGVNSGVCVCVVLTDSGECVASTISCPQLTDNAIRERLGSPDDHSGKQWLGSMDLLAQRKDEFRSQRDLAAQTMEEGCNWLGEVLGKPLLRHAGNLGCERGTLVFIAHGLLAMLPIHAARWEEGDRICWLTDRAPVVVVPGISVMAASERNRPPTNSVVVIADSRCDLAGAITEGRFVSRILGADGCTLVMREDATFAIVLKLIRSASHVHVAGHSDFHWYSPFLSSILLQDRNITVADVLALPPGEVPRSVVLSSCSSGVSSGLLPANGSWGFPFAFHCAGVGTVISTLWPVSDLAMTLFCSELYAHYARGRELGDCVEQARKFLRTSTRSVFQAKIAEIADGKEQSELLKELQGLSNDFGEMAPLSHPYYWGSVVCSGR